MDSFELEIKMGFLEEAKEMLSNAEQCFLNLEKAKDDPSIIEEIFRVAHNFKGSAGAVGFNDLKDFAHKFESLLLKIKQKEIDISAGIISLLLECNDYLIAVLDLLKNAPEGQHTNQTLLSKIEACLAGDFSQIGGETSIEESSSVDPTSSTYELLETEKEPPSGDLFAEESVIETQIEVAPPSAPTLVTPQPIPTPATTSASSPNSAQAKTPANADETVRVALSKIDHLLNNVGELVILQTVLDQQKTQSSASLLMQKTISQMSKIIKEVQGLSMSLRMFALKQTFQKMQRIVRDTSKALAKDIEFTFSGEETELDKTVIEQLSDPLVHLIRNAVDHGIEDTEARKASGKNPIGHVSLKAYQRGSQIVLEIRDDGKGLDPEKLMAKAKEKGILKPDAKLSNEDAYKLIFAPGFSTKEQVTDVSGRGVGMDVVKTNITQIKGEIEIESEVGKGSCFRVILPLTMAIIDGMVISLNEERYVVPIAQIHESLKPKPEDIQTINETGEMLVLRGQPLALYRLDGLLKRKSSKQIHPSEGIALVCQDANREPFAIFVDDILCQQQVVIKSLGEEIKGVKGISGAAILGDGKASLILDLFDLTSKFRNKTKNSSEKLKEAI